MSYMLQFSQSGPLPDTVASPPFVLFGINDIDFFMDLPPKIPLALVLHFAPILNTWILPTPDLSSTAVRLALRTPYVGINILADIDVEGLSWIVAKMLQQAGLPLDREIFLTMPNLLTSVAIHKAWLALDLPVSGIEALHIHIVTQLMINGPVTLADIKAIWNAFPVTSPIVKQMGLNFVRSHIGFAYTQPEFSAIRHWYLESRERCRFFRSLESQFQPEFDNVRDQVMKAASEQRNRANANANNPSAIGAAPKQAEILEKGKSKRVSPKDKLARETRDQAAMRRRTQRARSNESLRSVDTAIWDPKLDEGESVLTTGIPHSTPVDSEALCEMLEEMRIEERVGRESKEGRNLHTSEGQQKSGDESEWVDETESSKSPDNNKAPSRFRVRKRKQSTRRTAKATAAEKHQPVPGDYPEEEGKAYLQSTVYGEIQ